jgi:hypothetical protein
MHRDLCTAAYDQNVMSEGTVRQWLECSKMGGRTNVCDEKRSGGPAICSERWLKVLINKSVKDGASQFQNFHVNFHKFQALFSKRLSQLG